MSLFKRGDNTREATRGGPSTPRQGSGSGLGDDVETPARDGQPPPPVPPLGWYPDPDNPTALRFWNGDAWDAAEAHGLFAVPLGLDEDATLEHLSSPAEARGAGAPSAMTGRVLTVATVAAAGIVGTAALLAVQPEPTPCYQPTPALGAPVPPEYGRTSNGCTPPEPRIGQGAGDPAGPHGPYGPYSTRAELHQPDPGV